MSNQGEGREESGGGVIGTSYMYFSQVSQSLSTVLHSHQLRL